MALSAVGDFESHRDYLTGLAYRMLGSVAEAEDAVQDAYLRWHKADRDDVNNTRAYLSAIVTRLCLDRWKEARRRREIYVGPWLPEPIVGDAQAFDPAAQNLARDVSYALMLALERLSPLERAAFLLHDVFDLDFRDIASALNRSEAACRQLAKRARANVQAARPRFDVETHEGEHLAEAFFQASRTGDAAVLRQLLAEHATLHSDGGGRRTAALRVITGAEKICRLYGGLARNRKSPYPPWAKRLTLNGLPGWLTVEQDGQLQTTALEITDEGVAAIYITRNPEKLDHLALMVPESFTTSVSSNAH